MKLRAEVLYILRMYTALLTVEQRYGGTAVQRYFLPQGSWAQRAQSRLCCDVGVTGCTGCIAVH